MSEIRVRRVQPDEWRRLRELRLEALREAPLAFGSTLAREQAYDDARWQREAQEAAGGDGVVGFVAVDEQTGQWHALARGYVDHAEVVDGRAVVWLIGVYVRPAHRRRGVACAVSGEVIEWARERGAAEVRLHVGVWNTAARRTYEALGFAPTAATVRLSHEPSVVETEMRLDLDSRR